MFTLFDARETKRVQKKISVQNMITVHEAKRKILAHSDPLDSESRKLGDSLGFVLSDDLPATISMPAFRQSSMDGYAIRAADVKEMGTELTMVGEAKAGQNVEYFLEEGTAIRIFTGAMVPNGATAVVMQEHVTRNGDGVKILEFPVKEGKNIREVGQLIKEGQIALTAQTVLGPGALGFLAGQNIAEVPVFKRPKVGILVTGDELGRLGDSLELGQVYESNSYMLKAALKQEGVENVEVLYAGDELNATINALQNLARSCDVILASGGISVGDYDFVGKALNDIGAETIFYKVKQKPGKPLMFAKNDQVMFFALPGNPASSLVCYYEYVLPALRKMSGRKDCFLPSIQLPISKSYRFDGERDEFLKAIATFDGVIPLDGQESFAIRSFAIANAIIYLPLSQNQVEAGDMVEVHLLPM